MDNRILMGLLGLITAIIIYIDIKKKNKKEMSGFTLIRAWGVVITGIMIAIICFIQLLLGLD